MLRWEQVGPVPVMSLPLLAKAMGLTSSELRKQLKAAKGDRWLFYAPNLLEYDDLWEVMLDMGVDPVLHDLLFTK